VHLTRFEELVKSILDYVLATALLVIFAPAWLFVIVRLLLAGSPQVFLRHRVLGRYGRAFDQFTFPPGLRSEFLRKLPGLLNVLRGELSLVGPRPIGGRERQPPGPRLAMLTIRPGLTGPWRQTEGSAEQALLDLYYIRSYSIWLDLHVLFGRVAFRIGRTAALLHRSGRTTAGQAG